MPSSQGELTVQLETRTFWQHRCRCRRVGVDFEVVDSEVVDAGEQEAEMAAFEDGEVAKDDVAAVLRAMALLPTPAARRRRWGSCRGPLGWLEAEALAKNEAGAGDAEVVKVLAQSRELCQ